MRTSNAPTTNASLLTTGTLPVAALPALTGDITTSTGSAATTIAPGAVTLAKQSNASANSLRGNNTGSAATPLDLTVAQVKSLLALAATDVSGIVGTYALLASPALTGTPTAPTATAGTNTTQIATTAFVATSFLSLAGGTMTGLLIPYSVGGLGQGNFAIGQGAGNSTSSGVFNMSLGYTAGSANTTGGYNVAIGPQALSANQSGQFNIGIGFSAGNVATGSSGVFVGQNAGANTTSGAQNVLVGRQAGYSNTTGANGTFIGFQAGYLGATGAVANTSGANNTYVGCQASSNSASATNRTALGYNAVATADNQVMLGNTSTTQVTIGGGSFSARIAKRAPVITQSAAPAINTDLTDVAHITGLAQAITSMTTNLTGTPVEGDELRIDITDNGTARAITWGASFEASGTVALPTTTVISTRLDVRFHWNSATSKWRCVMVA